MSFFDGNRRLYVFVYADVKHLSLDRAFDSRPIQWESTNSTKLKRQRGRGVKKGGGKVIVAEGAMRNSCMLKDFDAACYKLH